MNEVDQNLEDKPLGSYTRAYNSLGLLWIFDWVWELLAVYFSIICLLALTVFLAADDGKPLANWRVASTDITPNTVVSIASTLVKASILLPLAQGISRLKWTYFQRGPHPLPDIQTFDNASRGPWGAMILMLKLRGRALSATLGAVLTILTLALDPFDQQILAYPVHTMVASNYTATVGIATYSSVDNNWTNAWSSSEYTHRSASLSSI